MRFTVLLPAILAVAPSLAAAAGTLGFALGDKNADGSCKTTQDYETDFDSLSGVTKIVRTYSASECDTAANIIPACKSKGFQVIIGVWYVPFLITWVVDLGSG